MPVKSTEPTIPPKMNLLDFLSTSDHLLSSYPVSEPLLPDDIWKKFELDFPELSGIDGFNDIFDEEMSPPIVKSENSLFPLLDEVWAGNHDCMWAGHCASKEHNNTSCNNNEDHRQHSAAFMKPPPVPAIKQEHHHNTIKSSTACHPQSLLKPTVRAAAAVASMPQTPPMSDDEEAKQAKPATSVLKLLHDAIEDCDLEEDVDLCDYFEDKDEEDEDEDVVIKEEPEDEEEEESEDEEEEDEEKPDVVTVDNNNIKSFQIAAESDHSYHKGKSASMRMANFGIDTPSDSEEEIDVVSVVDKLQFNNRMVYSLPTNPSNRDRQQIQRRMATAITKNKMSTTSSGIKTILPLRRATTGTSSSTTPEASPTKRKAQAVARGMKRSRQYKTSTTTTTPYKRRNYGHSSDSEPEPSEKRSLHNNMERQRRIDLRNAFEDLRVLVPEVSKKERAAKVVILREASQYCDLLTNTCSSHVKHLEDLKRQQEWLRQRVSQLRRNLAAKR
uniref:Transcription factor n=1 Tax=Colaphellus bowringi TaxID=561076 RepID=A0A8G0QEK4_9CUCU|nr:transcription factor [Colaphellus bowringi]